MAMKRFIAKDGKYAWFDTNRHKLVDGELILLKPEPKKEIKEEDVEEKTTFSRRKRKK